MKNIVNICLLCAFLLSACGNIIKGPYRFEIKIPNPEETGIKKSEIESAIIKGPHVNPADAYLAEIVIYKYSSGADVFSISEGAENNVTLDAKKGFLEAMIKVKKGGEILKILFIKASGGTKEEIIRVFAAKLEKELNIR